MEGKEMRADALPRNYRLHNRYILGDVLGWGGFGITYVAWDSEQNCQVAVKELYPSSFVLRTNGHTVCPRKDSAQIMEKMKEAFSREALTMIKLQNLSGIIKIFHVFDDNNTIYFSMELLKGVDFRKYLKKHGAMQWNQLSEMMRPVLRGLNALHQKGLIHRDISPDNIFICTDGSARLIDFGLARKFEGNNSFTVNLKECFAPWEQYDSSGKQGPWTDVYAMGVTLYVALSGVLPPPAPDRIAKVKKTAPLSEVCPNIPSYVAASIDKAMAVKIENRYENIGQLCEALYGKRPEPPPEPSVDGPMLVCLQGVLAGCAWPIRPNTTIRIGRAAELEISLPGGPGGPVKGVSRLHCILMLNQEGTFLLKDEGSTYGTIVNGGAIRPNLWYSLLKGSWIMIGQQIFQIQ